jgi:hypothetical protein
MSRSNFTFPNERPLCRYCLHFPDCATCPAETEPPEAQGRADAPPVRLPHGGNASHASAQPPDADNTGAALGSAALLRGTRATPQKNKEPSIQPS